jgi:hypothetical protein
MLGGGSKSDAQPKHASLEKLDLDGDLVRFLNTDTVEQHVLAKVDQMSQMMSAALPNEDAELQSGFEMVKKAIEWSGLLSLDSYAMSMKPVDGTLNRAISVVEYAEEDAQRPLWRVGISEPKVLAGIGYVPDDAVYTVNSTASLNEIWKTSMEAVETFCVPEQAESIKQQIAFVETMLLDTQIAAMTESMDDEILISIQLSESKTVSFPAANGAITIGEPNLLIGFKTKSPKFGEFLLKKLTESGAPLQTSEHGGYTLHTLNLPVPSPVPVQPTLMVTDEYLLIGSTQAGVIRALDSAANKSGLVSTPLYKKLLKDVPAKVSQVTFVSPRFMQTYVDVVKQTVSAAGPEAGPMMDMMLGAYEKMCAGSYCLKTSTGLYSQGYADYGGANPVEMVATAYTGMLAAIGVPSIVNAYSASQEKSMMRNVVDVEKAKSMALLPADSGGIGARNGQNVVDFVVSWLGWSDLSDLDVGEKSLDRDDMVIGTRAAYE